MLQTLRLYQQEQVRQAQEKQANDTLAYREAGRARLESNKENSLLLSKNASMHPQAVAMEAEKTKDRSAAIALAVTLTTKRKRQEACTMLKVV